MAETETMEIDDIDAQVVVNYYTGAIVVHQPKRLGGRIDTTMDSYNNFPGDLRAFVLALREGWEPR